MKNMTLVLTALLSLGIAGCGRSQQGPVRVNQYEEPIRVACVGDSITFGSAIEDREANSYPAQLQRMLGSKWRVRNFGVPGATLLKNGDLPYWKQDAFGNAIAWNPDVVIIKLGTNDTKPQNWRYADQFVRHYMDMVEIFQALPSQPRIWICEPVPAYQERWGIRDAVVREEVIPKVREVAEETEVGLIDLYTPLSGKPNLFPDKIHPNAAGAGEMARVIYREITGKKPPVAATSESAAPALAIMER